MALGKLKEKKGQSYAECCFHSCNEKGRVLARIGKVEIAYCAYHRKRYGERVLNALVNARFNGKLSKFMSETKHDMFMNDKIYLCEDCQKKEAEYIKSKIHEVEALEEEAIKYGLDKDNLSENDDSEWEFEDEKGN